MSDQHNPQPYSPYDPDSTDLFLHLLVQTREKMGVSQGDLGEKLGISAGIVDFYEQRGAPLGIIHLRAWLRALDVPFAEFIASLDAFLGPEVEPFVSTVFDIPLAEPAPGGIETSTFPAPGGDDPERRLNRALDEAIDDFEDGGYPHMGGDQDGGGYR